MAQVEFKHQGTVTGSFSVPDFIGPIQPRIPLASMKAIGPNLFEVDFAEVELRLLSYISNTKSCVLSSTEPNYSAKPTRG